MISEHSLGRWSISFVVHNAVDGDTKQVLQQLCTAPHELTCYLRLKQQHVDFYWRLRQLLLIGGNEVEAWALQTPLAAPLCCMECVNTLVSGVIIWACVPSRDACTNKSLVLTAMYICHFISRSPPGSARAANWSAVHALEGWGHCTLLTPTSLTRVTKLKWRLALGWVDKYLYVCVCVLCM